MLRFSKNSLILVVSVFLGFTGSLNAQYIIVQNDYEIPLSYSLIPENMEIESQEQEAMFFMSIPVEKLQQAAQQEGFEIQTEPQTIYVDGENFSAEMNAEMGKMTTIANAADGLVYMVMWDQKQVVVMSSEDMKKIQEQANAAAEEMINGLSPEMQEQVRAAMKEEQQEKSKKKSIAKSTGKKLTINGFDCELYTIMADEGSITGIWAAEDKMNITGIAEKMISKLNQVFQTDENEESDDWSLVKGKIPVEVRNINSDMSMGEPVIGITAIRSIEKKKPPKDKFYVPDSKDGFIRLSYSEYMQQMMQGQ